MRPIAEALKETFDQLQEDMENDPCFDSGSNHVAFIEIDGRIAEVQLTITKDGDEFLKTEPWPPVVG